MNRKFFETVKRCFAGVYIFVLFAMIFPESQELLSAQGFGEKWFQSSRIDSIFVGLFMTVGLFSGLLMCSRKHAAFAIPASIVCYSLLTLKNRVIGFSPEQPFVTWALFLIWLQNMTFARPNSLLWQISFRHWFSAVWIFGVVAYCYIGYVKLVAPGGEWLEGTALKSIVTTSVFARIWTKQFLDLVPDLIFFVTSWISILVELGAPLFIASKNLRNLWLYHCLLFHILCLVFLSIPPVSIGMILYHIVLFETGNDSGSFDLLKKLKKFGKTENSSILPRKPHAFQNRL